MRLSDFWLIIAICIGLFAWAIFDVFTPTQKLPCADIGLGSTFENCSMGGYK